MSIVDAARDAADRLLLLDECDITRQGEQTFNDTGGTYTVPETIVASSLACNLTPYRGVGTGSRQLGDEAVNVRNYLLSIPWDAPEVLEEDTVTMTISRDPLLFGRQFRVVHPEGETFQTSRRLIVESIRPSQESGS